MAEREAAMRDLYGPRAKPFQEMIWDPKMRCFYTGSGPLTEPEEIPMTPAPTKDEGGEDEDQ